jgi:hypothetical protein
MPHTDQLDPLSLDATEAARFLGDDDDFDPEPDQPAWGYGDAEEAELAAQWGRR